MAIDNDTSYELTGAQVKDLAQKIRNKADDNLFLGASSNTAGSKGLVPAPAAGDQNKILAGDGTWKALANIFYPVGSIYMSATLATAADVEAALGGTWTAWGAGRVPVGVDTNDTDFDTAEETGGEKTHALTTQEMPPHSHQTKSVDSGTGSQGKANGTYYQGGWWGNYDATTTTGGSSGTVVAHNNLQPYITCYMYKRTA